jgi:predicted Co/Zn/Cd cation transporter (cation efflux family)
VWGNRPGARQNITEKGRLAELRIRILSTFVLIGSVQALMIAVVVVLGLIDYTFFEFIIENIRPVIACLIVPVFIGLPTLVYVVLRDIFDPNFEPLNQIVERTSPLWPWRGFAQKVIRFVKGKFMQ